MTRFSRALFLLLVGSGPATAEPKALGAFEAWTAIEVAERGGKVCYMAARPAQSEGKYARRGEVSVSVAHRPAAKVRGEVSFQAGYPFKDGAPVMVDIDGKKFELLARPDVDPETAWARDGAADKALIEAMRVGRALAVKGVSARNTETLDIFPLAGFSRAYAEIGKACEVK
ncbi:MAG: invasion associated locus B family protein [Pseudomonadota bacterium]